MLPLADRIRMLHSQGMDTHTIAVRLGCEYSDVIDTLVGSAPTRKRGRPSTQGRCRHCGAPPCAQRAIRS